MEEVEVLSQFVRQSTPRIDQPGIEAAPRNSTIQERENGNHVEREGDRGFDPKSRTAGNQLTHYPTSMLDETLITR